LPEKELNGENRGLFDNSRKVVFQGISTDMHLGELKILGRESDMQVRLPPSAPFASTDAHHEDRAKVIAGLTDA